MTQKTSGSFTICHNFALEINYFPVLLSVRALLARLPKRNKRKVVSGSRGVCTEAQGVVDLFCFSFILFEFCFSLFCFSFIVFEFYFSLFCFCFSFILFEFCFSPFCFYFFSFRFDLIFSLFNFCFHGFKFCLPVSFTFSL